jgi:hypothetical protein
LEIDGALVVQRPGGFVVPSLKELEDALPALIAKACAKSDGKDRFTTLTFEEGKEGKKEKTAKDGENESSEE